MDHACICRMFDAETVLVDPSCPASEHGPIGMLRRVARATEVKTPYKPADRRLVLEDGKYIFRKDIHGHLIALRYGERWREFVGDKAVSALFDYAMQQRDLLRLALSADAPWSVEVVLGKLLEIAQGVEQMTGAGPGRNALTMAIECGKGCLHNFRTASDHAGDSKLGGGDVGCEAHNVQNCPWCRGPQP